MSRNNRSPMDRNPLLKPSARHSCFAGALLHLLPNGFWGSSCQQESNLTGIERAAKLKSCQANNFKAKGLMTLLEADPNLPLCSWRGLFEFGFRGQGFSAFLNQRTHSTLAANALPGPQGLSVTESHGFDSESLIAVWSHRIFCKGQGLRSNDFLFFFCLYMRT